MTTVFERLDDPGCHTNSILEDPQLSLGDMKINNESLGTNRLISNSKFSLDPELEVPVIARPLH